MAPGERGGAARENAVARTRGDTPGANRSCDRSGSAGRSWGLHATWSRGRKGRTFCPKKQTCGCGNFSLENPERNT